MAPPPPPNKRGPPKSRSGDRPDRSDRVDKSGRSDRGDRQDKSASGRPDRPPADRSKRPNSGGPSSSSGRPSNSGPPPSNRPLRPDQQGRPSRSKSNDLQPSKGRPDGGPPNKGRLDGGGPPNKGRPDGGGPPNKSRPDSGGNRSRSVGDAGDPRQRPSQRNHTKDSRDSRDSRDNKPGPPRDRDSRGSSGPPRGDGRQSTSSMNDSLNKSGEPTIPKEREEAAKEFRLKGNAAFQQQKWSDAIRFYSQALRLDNRHFTCYSNRSAAYLKRGKLNEALQDANACVKMKGDYPKGHLRRGAALFEMKRFDDARIAYQQGLKYCPNDKALVEGLQAAKLAKVNNSKATKAVRSAAATRAASKSRRRKANNSKSVSSFVKETKANLDLQMATIRSQLDLLKELETMSQDEKLDLLFSSLDKDGNGYLDPKELARGLRKKNVEMSFSDSIQKAIDLVARFDDDGNCRLGRDEFQNFVDGIVRELSTNVNEFAEFLVFQLIFSDDDEKDIGKVDDKKVISGVKGKHDMIEMLNDERMMTLFMLFDKNSDGAVGFKEVAMGLYQLTHSMEESAKATMQLLLMMDENDQRTIGYEQFAKLIMAIVAAADSTFDEVADDLTHALTSGREISKEAMAELVVADKIYEEQRSKEREEKKQQKIMDALSYERTQRLFDLLDENGDGNLDLRELMNGLKRHQNAVGMKNDVKKTAKLLLKADQDGDNQLDREEFGGAIVKYAEVCKTDLHELIDFMCVCNALGDNTRSNYEKAYTQTASHSTRKKMARAPKIRDTDVD